MLQDFFGVTVDNTRLVVEIILFFTGMLLTEHEFYDFHPSISQILARRGLAHIYLPLHRPVLHGDI